MRGIAAAGQGEPALARLPRAFLALGKGEGREPLAQFAPVQRLNIAVSDGFDVRHQPRFEAVRDRLTQSITSAWQQRQLDLEQDAVVLAYASVCSILGTKSEDKDTVHRVVQQVMQTHKLDGLIRIRLSPEDWRWMGFNDMPQNPESSSVNWESDPQLKAGDCMIEGQTGTLDARLATQLDNLRALLLQVHNARKRVISPGGSLHA